MKSIACLSWIRVPSVLMAAMLLLVAGPAFGVADILDVHRPLPDFDARTGSVAPDAAALAAADALGATARWNRFGTPSVLFNPGGSLGAAPAGAPADAAREWLRQNRDLFRLSAASVGGLVVVRQSQLPDSGAHVVLFGQSAGTRMLANEGRIKVALAGDEVIWVSSSAVGDIADPGAATLGAAEAWTAAAGGVGLSFLPSDLVAAGADGGWTMFEVPGLSHPQRVREVLIARPGAGVVPAFETIVLDVQGGGAMAYTSFVDGFTGEVLVRTNRTWQIANVTEELLPAAAFQGSYQDDPDPRACGPLHGPYTVASGDAVRAIVEAGADILANDIFIRLYRGSALVAEEDLGTSPELMLYEPAGGVPGGDYYVQICPYGNPTAPPVPPYTYTGAITFENTELPDVFTVPRWRYFLANPEIDLSSTDTRSLACWTLADFDGTPISGCDLELDNLASRAPWDYDYTTGQATFTTTGNNAFTSESWLSPLTPSAPYRPVAADRDYSFPWTNQWQESGCDPTVLTHTGVLADNDIDAAVANLFATHNRMHDWSYFLGFTEGNGNAQVSNFGRTPANRQYDPEIGNSQAGAVTGGAPSYLGRDNANQITLNDGIAPISNMYLWQPIAGAAYPPCVDGDFDMAIVGHEYGHMIQNRMVDPDNGLSGGQGRAMGESWGDLTAAEFLNAQGLAPVGDENPFAVGAYATGDKETGVRNFSMDDSPLNYSNMDYDPVGLASASPHANGEIWSAVNFDIREALIAKYDASYPASDLALQQRCADGEEPVTACPGNRRWVQIMHDAFLLMPSTPTMLDARDAYLAADRARAASSAWPSNQAELWNAFARRGFGGNAATSGPADVEPTPSFASPAAANATVTFDLVARDEGNAPVAGEIYVGRFEARTTPIADTHAGTALGATAELAPGTYDLVVRADGYGHHRFTATFSAGQTVTKQLQLRTNWASAAKGATAQGDGDSFHSLIDDSEATTWQRLGATPDVDGTTVTVVLNGRKPVRRVQVSAMPEPGENRFETLRAFTIQTCDASVTNCAVDANFTTVYTSADDAFPGGSFRPNIDDWYLRSFDVQATRATHVRLIVDSNQCTGNPTYQDGSLDNDPNNETDCRLGSAILAPRHQDVTAAELQVFKR